MKILKNNTVYIVNAFRWGIRKNHSYLVGVWSDPDEAIEYAEAEVEATNGLYSCEVLKCNKNVKSKGVQIKLILGLTTEGWKAACLLAKNI